MIFYFAQSYMISAGTVNMSEQKYIYNYEYTEVYFCIIIH